MPNHPVSLLLVEDDELDVEAFLRVMRKQQLDIDLQVARDGVEALERLRATASQPQKRLILLDLNMPRMNGHEFLAELRADDRLQTTIVFVFTSSDHGRDIEMAYRRNVAGYFLKSELKAFTETVSHYVQGTQFPVAVE